MTEYPLLELFWTMLWFFLFIAWITLLFGIFHDIFRSPDLSGWGKAGWTLLTVIMPFLGVLIYLIVRGGEMHHRNAEDSRRREEATAEYIRSVATAPAGSVTDELTKLAHLRESGALTDAEFEAQKASLLGKAS
jgi:hypothetical protein